jgi:adenylate cyclase
MVRERVGDWRLSWRFALAGLLAGLLVIALAQTAVVAPLFFALQDQLFPAPPPSPQVTLVALDSASGGPFGPYPWSNDIHARVIDYLSSLHPKVILFDVMVDHSDAGDRQLETAIGNAGNVILVCTPDDSPLPQFMNAAAAVAGRDLGAPDPANAVRGVPVRLAKTCTHNTSGDPAFIQAVRMAEGLSGPVAIGAQEARLGRHTIPLVDGQMLINFTNGHSPTCSYVAAYQRHCPDTKVITDHVVVVGIKLVDADDIYSQAVSFFHDASFCPQSRPRCMVPNQNYGYRIMGDAISTVLNDRYVRPQPDSSDLVATLLIATLVGTAVYVLSFRRAVLVIAIALAAYAMVTIVLGRAGFLADPIYTPVAILLAAGFSLAARYVLEERERRKVERIFGHYIDPRVAQQLAASRSVEDLMSRGERRELTVLFMDIRGFTAMSETMDAADVLKIVTEYLDRMSALILKWDGLIDKYVGDEVMALWNVPLAQPEHALLAIRCAYDLVQAAPEMEARLAARGLPPISYGIGINTGPSVVGNMGSSDRLQYTALGDTVNTAARFCSVAPAFDIIVGWPTYQACADYIAVDEMPGLQLKGKSAETFRLFRVTAIREDSSSPWVPIPSEAANAAYAAGRKPPAAEEVFA